jgi:hypothetical protein
MLVLLSSCDNRLLGGSLKERLEKKAGGLQEAPQTEIETTVSSSEAILNSSMLIPGAATEPMPGTISIGVLQTSNPLAPGEIVTKKVSKGKEEKPKNTRRSSGELTPIPAILIADLAKLRKVEFPKQQTRKKGLGGIKITSKEWETFIREFLEGGFEVLANNGLKSCDELNDPELRKVLENYYKKQADFYKGVFENYYKKIHCLFTFGKIENVYKQFKNSSLNWGEALQLLGYLVACCETLYEELRNSYAAHKGADNITLHLNEKLTNLQNNIYPILQRMFDAFMEFYKVYMEKEGAEKLDEIGPIKDAKGQPLCVEGDGDLKYVCYYYKQGKMGEYYSIFTLNPQRSVILGPNLYQDYVPYSPHGFNVPIIYKLGKDGNPNIVTNSGVIASLEEGFISVTPYQLDGSPETLSFPITHKADESIGAIRKALQDEAAESRTYSQEEEKEMEIGNVLQDKAAEIHTHSQEEERKEKETMEYIESEYNELPTQIKKSVITNVVTTGKMPQKALKFFISYLKKELADPEKGRKVKFIPFPRTPIEAREQMYLYLLGLQKMLQEGQPLPKEDIHLLDYLGLIALPPAKVDDLPEELIKEEKLNHFKEKLDQIIKEKEEELLESYTEEEEKIHLEQEERSRRVATGKIYEEKQKKTQQGKKHRKIQEKPKVKQIKQKEEKKIEVEKLKDSSQAKARKRLEELKESSKNESMRFREYMSLINELMKLAKEVDPTLEWKLELNKSSHGVIKVGETKQSFVRPHGNREYVSLGNMEAVQELIKTLIKGLQ